MKKIIKILKFIYFYSALLIALFFLFKCYELYFFNDFFVKIPNILDIKYEDAKKLEKYGLKLKVSGEINSIKPIGVICKQSPAPFSLVKRGSSIKIFISKGIKKIEVPNLIDEELDEAEKILREMNILIGNVDFIFSESFDFNKVISTDPKEGILIPFNKRVSLLVSKGSKNKIAFIPDVIGLDFDKVKEIIKLEGLLIGKITYRRSNYDKNIVLDIFPKVGEKLFKGSIVDLVLSE